MTFEKNHKLGAKLLVEERLDDSPICFRAKKGIKDKLKAIPHWQDLFRDYAEKLVKDKDNL